MSDLTFKEVVQKTGEVIDAFQKVEQREWGVEGCMIELMKQVGELSKNIMVLEKYYFPKMMDNPYYSQASKEAIGNELSDILFIIIRIAKHYGVDLEKAHLKELNIALMSIQKK